MRSHPAGTNEMGVEEQNCKVHTGATSAWLLLTTLDLISLFQRARRVYRPTCSGGPAQRARAVLYEHKYKHEHRPRKPTCQQPAQSDCQGKRLL